MKNIPLMLLLPVIIAGCSRHYYRVEDKEIMFFLKAPEADNVLFVSSLEGYKPFPAQSTDRKTWVVRMPSSQEFSYFYLIDGELFVPDCPYREYDEFGYENCIYIPGM